MGKVKFSTGISGEPQMIDEQFYEEVCKSSNVYEIPPTDVPVKLFCDIDIYDEEFDYEDAISGIDKVIEIAIDKVETVTRALGRKDQLTYTICNSHSPSFKCWKTGKRKWKVSLHIIFNVLATKKQQGIIFKFLNFTMQDENDWKDYFPPNSKFFDVSVYGVEKFRAVHSSKPDENRPLVIEQGHFEASVISAFFDENSFVIDENHENFVVMKELLVKPPSSSTSKGEKWENEFLVTQYIERGLLTKYAKDYASWFPIFSTIVNMFDEETSWRLGDAFSRLSSNYDESGNLKSFYKLLGRETTYGIQNIRSLAKKSDKAIYDEIETEKKELIKQKKAEDAKMKKLEKEEFKRLKIQETKEKAKEERNKKVKDIKEHISVTTCETEIEIEDLTETEKLIEISLQHRSPTDYDIAKALNSFIDVKYSHHNKTWYIFNGKWNTDLAGNIVSKILSEDFCRIAERMVIDYCDKLEHEEDAKEQDYIAKKVAKLAQLVEGVKNNAKKNNILAELKTISHDEELRKQMNKQMFLLPLKNHVIDLRTKELIPMTKEHLFDYECGANYITLTKEQEEYARKYFLDIFCGNEQTLQCFLDIIKTNMSGKVSRFIFFWVGSGRNGKSLLLKVINKMMDKAMDVISKDVVLMKKSNSHLSTEFEKLDKYRIGFITEISDTDVLNIDNIKAITGDDKIDVRGICKTNESIKPTINIHGAMNELPSFKGQKAIADRLVVIPFNNEFEVDTEFEGEIMSRIDWIFSFIIDNGNILDKFELSDEMKVAKEDYQEDNNTDNLKEFIQNMTSDGETQTTYFMIAYYDWLKKMKRWEKQMTSNAFTRRMKKLGFENRPSNGKYFYNLSLS
jgi:putative DNA primase/helicase